MFCDNLARWLYMRRGASVAIREISRTVPVVAACADESTFHGEVASLRRPGGATADL